MAEQVSIREFARRVGVSDVAVLKAIKAGKIVAAIDYTNPKRPKIDPEVALKEWGRNYDPSYHRTEKVTDRLGSETPEPKRAPRKSKSIATEPAANEQTAYDPQPTNGKSLAEIKRQTAEVKLHQAALELKKTRGELVDKQKVYRALYSAGQEVRTAFQAVPDRVIDDILAAKTRNEAHGILFNAIADTLDMLSEITNRDLNV